MRPKIDLKKISQLNTVNQILDDTYGKKDTPSRQKFTKKSIAYVSGDLLKEQGLINQIPKIERTFNESTLKSITESLNNKESLEVVKDIKKMFV